MYFGPLSHRSGSGGVSFFCAKGADVIFIQAIEQLYSPPSDRERKTNKKQYTINI